MLKIKRPYFLFLTEDKRKEKEVICHFSIVGRTWKKQPFYIRKITVWDELIKSYLKEKVVLKMLSQKDNIILVEVWNGVI